jgi:spermidine synthase
LTALIRGFRSSALRIALAFGIALLASAAFPPAGALGPRQSPAQARADTEYARGSESWVAGRNAEALAHFRKAIELAPNHVRAMIDAAWLLGCAPEEEPIRNPEEAVLLAGRATELTAYRDPSALDALAAAYAAAGDFDRAVRTADAALHLDVPEHLAEAIRSRQALYRSGYAFIVLDPR